MQADISVESDVLRLFETVDRTLGSPTALVNNAVRLEPQMRLESMSAARLQRIMATNVVGTMLCARGDMAVGAVLNRLKCRVA